MSERRRLRLSRARGFRLADISDNYRVVSRPSHFGNPFTLDWARLGHEELSDDQLRAHVVSVYRWWLTDDAWADQFRDTILPPRRTWILEHLHELAGKDLACWCPESSPCNADVLLAMARTEQAATR